MVGTGQVATFAVLVSGNPVTGYDVAEVSYFLLEKGALGWFKAEYRRTESLEN